MTVDLLAESYLGIPTFIWIILLVIGYFYGQFQAARLMMNAYVRRQRRKTVKSWTTDKTELLQFGELRAISFADDNAIAIILKPDGSASVLRLVCNAYGKTVIMASFEANDKAEAERIFLLWVDDYLADGKTIDGSEMYTPGIN